MNEGTKEETKKHKRPSDRTNKQTKERRNERTNERANERTSERANERTSERANERTSEANERTNERNERNETNDWAQKVHHVLPEVLVFQHVFLQHIVQTRVSSSSHTANNNKVRISENEKENKVRPSINTTQAGKVDNGNTTYVARARRKREQDAPERADTHERALFIFPRVTDFTRARFNRVSARQINGNKVNQKQQFLSDNIRSLTRQL